VLTFCVKNFKLFINSLLSTGGEAKKHVFGREGKVAEIGSHILAFVRGLFPCFLFCLYAAKISLLLCRCLFSSACL